MAHRYVIVGASRGIGAAVAKHLAPSADVFAVSRTEPTSGQWIRADVTAVDAASVVAAAVGEGPLDGLLYMGGTWEHHAFTPLYNFVSSTEAEIDNVLAVNLLAPIKLSRALLPMLMKSINPKIIFMGALSGRDNFPAREVANSASKFGLRGVVHSLREGLREYRIGVTVINPGNVATPEVLDDLGPSAVEEGRAIPLTDLLRLIDCVLAMSRATCVKEIDLPAMAGRGA